MVTKKYFGDSPKAAKIFARKYFPTEDIEHDSNHKSNQLPSPRELAEYEQIFEGAAEKIIGLIEKEQAQRHAWENKALQVQNFGRRLGQTLFALMVLAIVYASLALIESTHVIPGVVLGVVGFGSLVIISFLIRQQRFNIEKRFNYTNRYNKFRERR
jgi:uncharacterized membrane protein